MVFHYLTTLQLLKGWICEFEYLGLNLDNESTLLNKCDCVCPRSHRSQMMDRLWSKIEKTKKTTKTKETELEIWNWLVKFVQKQDTKKESPSENIQKLNLNISRHIHHTDGSHCLFRANLLHMDYTALCKNSQWSNQRELLLKMTILQFVTAHQHGALSSLNDSQNIVYTYILLF